MKVVITTPAREDLKRIAAWIAEENPRRAKSFSRELRDASMGLGSFPESNTVIGLIDGCSVRRKVYGNYLIFYAVTRNRVEVLRVMHGAQDYSDLF